MDFRGGTVLALRHAHRFSKDIDIFVRDPQYRVTCRRGCPISPPSTIRITKREPSS
ncbi:MAG: nucleotidyl transferase AbiEii/AbiGii toxin family protein [Burkholderiaceae bacterium]|nr:nucleotidyl transferase AbiEii/AbiGii toxin family protein [Burkholderiaceae bacterium]